MDSSILDKVGNFQIRGSLAAATSPSSARLHALVVEVLSIIDDDIAADLIEQLALSVADRDEELRAIREVLSVALDIAHRTGNEGVRLRKQLLELRHANRREVAK